MTARYLLDTNVVSDLVRNPRGRTASKIREVGQGTVATSIIVAAEIRFGAAKSGSARLTLQVDRILGALEVMALEPPADAVYANLRASLEASGKPIGGNDLLIAAQALSLGMIVVTANEREFGRIEGLLVENWLA